MPRIENWEKVKHRNVSDAKEAGLLAMEVRKWRHRPSGDTLSIDWVHDEFGNERFDILYNGEAVEAFQTLTRAEEDVVDTMKARPQGL